MRRIWGVMISMGLVLGMSVGCAPAGLWRYPRPEIPEHEASEPELLTVTLPETADQILQDTMDLLIAKAKDISGGELLITVDFCENPLEFYENGKADVALLSDGQMAQLEPQLECVQLPFLFPSWQDLIIALRDPNGPVMDGSMAPSLGGQVLGIYYGGSWGLGSRSSLYLDEVGTEALGSLGIAPNLPGEEMLLAMGVQSLDTNSPEEQIQRFDSKELRAMELPLVNGRMPEELKCLYLTRHRVAAWWLLIREEAPLSDKGREYLRQAVAYTIASQDQARIAAEDAWLESLEGQGISVRTEQMDGVFAAGLKYVREVYREEQEISQKLWEKLLPAIGR